MPVKIVLKFGRNRILSEDVHYLKNCDSPLVINLARAFHWQDLIDDGKFSNIEDLAKAIGIDKVHVARIMRLTLLSPKIIHKIIIGEITFPSYFFRKSVPVEWKEQEKLLLEK